MMITAVLFGLVIFGNRVVFQFVDKVEDISSNFVFAAIPLFVFMGAMLEKSGIADKLFEAIHIWTRRLPGGLALATITIRKKEQLCALRPRDGVVMLETLFYPDEVRLEHGVDLDKAKVSEREMEMAFTLIELLRKPFEPDEYQDHYREVLAQLIEAKLEGRDVVKSPPARETKVIDLADALRQSVEAAKKGGRARTAAAKAPARRQTRARRARKAS